MNARVGEFTNPLPSDEIHLDRDATPRLLRLLNEASEIAEGLGHDYLGVEHFVLAVLREGRSVPGAVFSEMGVTKEASERILGIIQDPKYGLSSTAAVDAEGNEIGHFEVNEEGKPVLRSGRRPT